MSRRTRTLPACRAYRGVALLLVLAALVLTLPLAASAARRAMLGRLEASLDAAQRQAGDLTRAATAPILNWLHHEAAEVVLPLDAPTPEVRVLDDGWKDGRGILHRVTVTAYDQLGMVPIHAAVTASPLRLTLPEMFRLTLDQSAEALSRSAPLGLDTMLHATDGAGMETFPQPAAASPRMYADIARTASAGDGSDSGLGSVLPASSAVGAFLATHGHGPDTITLNVNTAPMQLLESAMLVTQSDLRSTITAARGRGEPARVQRGSPGMEGPSVEFASASSCWAFRVDVTVGPAHRSEWLVYQRHRNSWQEVQRLVIPE